MTDQPYKMKNKLLPFGIADAIYEYLKFIDMAYAVDMMHDLQCHMATALDSDNDQTTMDDLCDKYGPSELASQVRPILFYAGPEREYDENMFGSMDHRFKLVQGSALGWLVDTILFTITTEGSYDVLERLEIFLPCDESELAELDSELNEGLDRALASS